MKINSDVNILGGLPDFELIVSLQKEEDELEKTKGSFTNIRTIKSVKRFEKAIKGTLLGYSSSEQKNIVKDILLNEGISGDSLLLLFWNASVNNDLLHRLNLNVFFPAYYSGRIVLKQGEVLAYLNELKLVEKELQKWSESTIETTASKYLTLLKKFNLLEGSGSKEIKHPFLSDRMFILFTYWLLVIEKTPNILQSEWLLYSFSERQFFMDRILQKKFSRFFTVKFTGDRLHVEPLIKYKDIYYVITEPRSNNIAD